MESGDEAIAASSIEVFPVGIGYYRNFPYLDVDTQIGRLLDFLAPFGARHRQWAVPARERGAHAVAQRLREWAEADGPPGSSGNSVLYWVGHGCTDGTAVTLAHAQSPSPVGTAGVTPAQLAEAIRNRLALLQARGHDAAWALVVIDTCRSKRFVELVVNELTNRDPPGGSALLVGVSEEGATSLGRFTDALRRALQVVYLANQRIRLVDLWFELQEQSPGCWGFPLGKLTEAALVPVNPPVASYLSASLDTIRHLEDVLGDLSHDERWHFLVKAQGAEHGEAPWYFEGRDQEGGRIVSWLRHARSGLLVVTGRAGSGKSALLGDVLMQSLPDLRDALARRGLSTPLSRDDTPPDGVFDTVIHVRGLTLSQVVHRLADGAGIDLPSRTDPEVGIATDLDGLAAQLAEREAPFTVLVDALDEATDPLGIARSLLARISALPRVRVLIGTRASTNERPEAEAEDSNLLDALTATPAPATRADSGAPGSGAPGSGREARDAVVVWVGRDDDAVRRYVTRRISATWRQGVAGKSVLWKDSVTGADIERVAANVAGRDREFLFARLAVYELIEDPWLLRPERAWSLGNLLKGDHQDLFGQALDRLGHFADKFPVLLEALSLARGRGMPIADGTWATIAAALIPEMSHPADPEGSSGRDAEWAAAIGDLVDRAAAYIAVEGWSGDSSGSSSGSDRNDNLIGGGRPGTVFRLAQRTFVEYFDIHGYLTLDERRQRAATALLRSAASASGASPGDMPAYLCQHLSGHVADADLWQSLADQPLVLDRLSPGAVTSDAIRTLFGRRTVPAPVAGIIGAQDVLATASAVDRAGLRQLATTRYSQRHVIDEPVTGWGVAAARAGQATVHVRLTGHRTSVCKVRGLTMPDGRMVLVSVGDDGTIRLWDLATATPIGTPMTVPAGTVEDVCAFADPSGQVLLASVGSDATVRLWDPVLSKPVGEPMTGHSGTIYGICQLPGPDADCRTEGRTILATSGVDGTVRLWDPASGEPAGEPLAAHTGTVYAVCALTGPDGRTLLASAGVDETVRIWDPATGEQATEPLTGHRNAIFSLCPLPGLGPPGRTLLASAGGDWTVRIWDPFADQQAGEPLTGEPLTGHTGGVTGVCSLPGLDGAGNPDGRTWVASTGYDGTVRIWDPVSHKPVTAPMIGHDGAIVGVCALTDVNSPGRPSGRTLLATAGIDGTVRVWAPVNSQEVTGQETSDTPALYGVCAFPGPDGRTLLATASHDGTVRIWDPATGRPSARPLTGRKVAEPLTGQGRAVRSVCALPGQGTDGHPDRRTLLASVGHDRLLRIWDPVSAQPVRAPLTGHAGPVHGVCALPNPDPAGPSLLASAGADGTVRIWNPATAQPVGEPLTGHAGPVHGVCALPNPDPAGPSLLASAGADGTVRIWNPATGQPVGEPLTGHAGPVHGVCALPNPDPAGPSLLASAGADGTVRIWNPATAQPVGEPLTGHAGQVWEVCALPSPDPNYPSLLASAGYDGTVRIWNPATGQPVRAPLTGHAGPVWGVCALPSPDPDGLLLLASAGADGTARIWNPATGQPVGEPLVESPDAIEYLTLDSASPADCVGITGAGALRTWTSATASLAALPSPHRTSAVAVSASLDHDLLITGDVAGMVHITEMATGRTMRPPVRTGNGAVLALCPLAERPLAERPLADSPVRVAAAGREGTITVFALTSGQDPERIFHAHDGPVRDLCLVERPGNSPLLVSAGNDATIRAWDCVTWKPHGTPGTGHEGWIWAITSVSSPTRQVPWLASAGADGTVRLWDLDSGEQIGDPLAGHAGQVRAVTCATAVDGRLLLLSGGHDGTVRLWDPKARRLVHAIPLGIPVQSLLQQKSDQRSLDRTGGGATIAVGLRTGIVALDLGSSLFQAYDP